MTTSHPRITHGQRYSMPCLGWLAEEPEWEQGSGLCPVEHRGEFPYVLRGHIWGLSSNFPWYSLGISCLFQLFGGVPKDRRIYTPMYGNSHLCPTEHRPFGAAAQKPIKELPEGPIEMRSQFLLGKVDRSWWIVTNKQPLLPITTLW